MSTSEIHLVRSAYRLVLDTSVVVSAMRNRNGSSFKLLASCLDRQHVAIVTPALLMEYEAVLYRLQHQLDHAMLDRLIEEIAVTFEPARVHFNWRPQLSDPDDELVLEAAISGNASILATFNLRHFLPAANNFGIRVLTPGAIIAEGSFR